MTNHALGAPNGPFDKEMQILLTTDGQGKEAKREALERIMLAVHDKGFELGYREGYRHGTGDQP